MPWELPASWDKFEGTDAPTFFFFWWDFSCYVEPFAVNRKNYGSIRLAYQRLGTSCLCCPFFVCHGSRVRDAVVLRAGVDVVGDISGVGSRGFELYVLTAYMRSSLGHPPFPTSLCPRPSYWTTSLSYRTLVNASSESDLQTPRVFRFRPPYHVLRLQYKIRPSSHTSPSSYSRCRVYNTPTHCYMHVVAPSLRR